ncbi:MAG: tyrosine-type recombinase/integrase [Verrucomicrobiia bacterium]
MANLPFKGPDSSCHQAVGNLPIIGPMMGSYTKWLTQRGYQPSTVDLHFWSFRQLVPWLQRKRYRRLKELDAAALMDAYRYFDRTKRCMAGPVRSLVRFLRERNAIPERHGPVPPLEAEQTKYGAYMSEVRGLSQITVSTQLRRLRLFFKFLRLHRRPVNFQNLRLSKIEAYLRRAARSNSRVSMHGIVCCLRGFLRFKHAVGQLRWPLHQQIAAPCVYQMETLPRAIPWSKIQELLDSIDRSEPLGLRDFTMIYMAAAYGLRQSEVTGLTLDDINWRARTLRILQTKSRQVLHLPLTDEAADVLIRYMRESRPQSKHRYLFLKLLAPIGPLSGHGFHNVLRKRIRLSGLQLQPSGSHMLRHSLAAHLLQQGVTVKTIGDTLGHRAIRSTSTYLRLGVEQLREVALPLPPPTRVDGRLDWMQSRHRPRIRSKYQDRHLPSHFRSHFARTLNDFVELKRALGCRYAGEVANLRQWDDFMRRHYPKARKVNALMFTAWTKTLSHLTPLIRRRRQCLTRKFLVFNARNNTRAFIPDPTTFPKRSETLRPRLINELEMGRILDVVRHVPPSLANPMRSETLRIGLALLFCCGLRRGELERLKLGDIDLEQQLLHIRLTKFYKSRLVPLAPSVGKEMEIYLKRRQSKGLPARADSFLMWSNRNSAQVLQGTNLLALWHRCCVCAQVFNAEGHPPRLHDLRHSFAVGALQRWYAQGINVQAKLPHLAIYLGHVNVVSTHYYLQLTPELRQAAAKRYHDRFATLFTTGGDK